IIYSNKSIGSDRISDQNWPDILLNPEVRYGHSDPNSDPCGYRTLLSWKLAEKYYNRPGLYHLLDESRPKKNIRPKEVDLLALLDVGELDYVFIYRSVAEQHGYSYIVLPDEINLKSSAFESFYKEVSVEITGAKPGEKIVRKGAPIVYGITIPKSAQSPQWAARFVAFVLGPKGQKIMEANGQQAFVPARVDNYNNLPNLLKPLIKKE
ncbi:MAG: extracellular solute-binding protein, partial [Candidatus Aminicenantes bacterium]|nr:extracellular solute-binding protein [Candidatus Aminicenantes bacterium]